VRNVDRMPFASLIGRAPTRAKYIDFLRPTINKSRDRSPATRRSPSPLDQSRARSTRLGNRARPWVSWCTPTSRSTRCWPPEKAEGELGQFRPFGGRRPPGYRRGVFTIRLPAEDWGQAQASRPWSARCGLYVVRGNPPGTVFAPTLRCPRSTPRYREFANAEHSPKIPRYGSADRLRLNGGWNKKNGLPWLQPQLEDLTGRHRGAVLPADLLHFRPTRSPTDAVVWSGAKLADPHEPDLA